MEQKIYTSSSFKVLSTIQDVESKLKRPISKQTFGRLFSLLEDAQKLCQDQELLSRIIYLYGKVIDKYVDSEVQKIATLAKNPKSNLDILLRKIADVKLYGLSKENFSILKKVEQKIEKSKEPLYISTHDPLLEIEIVEDLFSLASLLYYEGKERAASSYLILPQEIQKLLLIHLTTLGKTLFEDPLSMIQALFATAHQVAEKPLNAYPTLQEIHRFFTEEQIIRKSEHPQYWDYKIN